MAIRVIREEGDPVLRKKARPVEALNERMRVLVEDMLETMYDAHGAGLAAPQVGVLRQVIVVDIGEGPLVLFNPKVTRQAGEQIENEGCLSIPGRYGLVKRPMEVTVRGQDKEFKDIEISASGYLSVALCHEIDHLNGILYKDRVIGKLKSGEVSDSQGEEEL